jgi:hypothetical protein
MIRIDKNGISYSGNKQVVIQNFIDMALNIVRIGDLNGAEIDRLCALIPSVIRNENLESKKDELMKDQRNELLNDLYSELKIKRVGENNG